MRDGLWGWTNILGAAEAKGAVNVLLSGAICGLAAGTPPDPTQRRAR